jgi:hypothetical protein
MKILAAIFAAIALPSALLGFGMDVLPILALLGKTAAVIALVGFAITVLAYMTGELTLLVNFDADDIHP